jgi:glycosyltransferase involved in cell wall biosynthesis
MSRGEVAEKLSGATGEGRAVPAVSVVIPAYNCAAYIAEALGSVFAQTFKEFEVIVVNDGSPDTLELERALEPYRARLVYLRQENRGVSAARNTGLRAARAPLVAFLDADDLWEPFYLEEQVGAMREDPALAVRYPNTLIFGDVPEAGKTFMDVNPSEGEASIEALLTQRCTVGNSVMARRDCVVGAGMFDEGLKRSEDFDLWLRILARGGRVGYTRKVLARYRRYAGSLSSDHVEMAADIVRVFDKAERTLELSETQRAVLSRERERFRAGLRLQEGKRAFARGDARAALEALREANRFLRSRKLSLAMLLIRVAPGLLLRAYDLRDRYMLKAGTRV